MRLLTRFYGNRVWDSHIEIFIPLRRVTFGIEVQSDLPYLTPLPSYVRQGTAPEK